MKLTEMLDAKLQGVALTQVVENGKYLRSIRKKAPCTWVFRQGMNCVFIYFFVLLCIFLW